MVVPAGVGRAIALMVPLAVLAAPGLAIMALVMDRAAFAVLGALDAALFIAVDVAVAAGTRFPAGDARFAAFQA